MVNFNERIIIDIRSLQVPSSRSEVFSTSSVNIIDKRMLMKFLTFALEFEKHEDEFKGIHFLCRRNQRIINLSNYFNK